MARPSARRLTRRALLGASAGLIALPAPGLAEAPGYPSRPLTLIVPWPAGGQTDLTMRLLGDLAARHLGQPVVVVLLLLLVG